MTSLNICFFYDRYMNHLPYQKILYFVAIRYVLLKSLCSHGTFKATADPARDQTSAPTSRQAWRMFSKVSSGASYILPTAGPPDGDTHHDGWLTDGNDYVATTGFPNEAGYFQGEHGAWAQIQLPYKIKLDNFDLQPGGLGKAERCHQHSPTPIACPAPGPPSEKSTHRKINILKATTPFLIGPTRY